MATFGVSSLGYPVVISEPPLPAHRFAMIMLTGVLGICSIIFIFFSSKNPSHYALLLSLFTVHMLVHTVHFADNIARPVDYFEGKTLYSKHLFYEMEITFGFNLPFTILGSWWFKQVLEFLEGVEKRRYLLWIGMIAFFAASTLTLGHYMLEVPSNFGAIENLSIAGEGIALLCFTLYCIVSLLDRPPAAAYIRLQTTPKTEVVDDEEYVIDDEAAKRAKRRRSREIKQ